jgi:hypothetical protein
MKIPFTPKLIIILAFFLIAAQHAKSQSSYKFWFHGPRGMSHIFLANCSKKRLGLSFNRPSNDSMIGYYLDSAGLHNEHSLLPLRKNFLGTYDFHIKEVLGFLMITNPVGNFICVQTDSTELDISAAHLNLLKLENSTRPLNRIYSLFINNSQIANLEFHNVVFNASVEFDNGIDTSRSEIDSISLIRCLIRVPLNFSNIRHPKFIYLDNVQFENTGSRLDFTHFINSQDNSLTELKVADFGDGFSRAILNYENFHLTFSPGVSDWQKERIYRQLLEEQQRDGFTFGFQKLDKEYKHFGYTKDNTALGKIHDFVECHWWDYGYNKGKVIVNSLYLFLIFTFINILIYPVLLSTYYPLKFKELEQRLTDRYSKYQTYPGRLYFHLARIPSIILYTAYLFWGLRLDLNEIEIRNYLPLTLIIIEYTIGVISLAYIANYIISK